MHGYDPEDVDQWQRTGRSIAQRNLRWSIFAEFLGFVVWQLWAITVVFLPKAGFELTTAQTFWLISMPALVGATLRVPYTFMVGRFGGRNWTVVSALLLLIPALGLGFAVADPGTPYWVLLLVAATAGFGGGFGAWRCMDNLAHAKGDVAGSLAAIREPHFWVLACLYIGTFGSFIGFSGVFPKLIVDTFPQYSTFTIGAAAVSLAFLRPLIGSLARPWGGRLADRLGGARMTVGSFALMAVLALLVVITLPLRNFWLFLALFLDLFAAAGIGNGATYRMIPAIYRVRGHGRDGLVSSERRSAAALGLISAVGAYGGFAIPQVLSASKQQTGLYAAAFGGFVAFYLFAMALCWACYLRRGSQLTAHKV